MSGAGRTVLDHETSDAFHRLNGSTGFLITELWRKFRGV